MESSKKCTNDICFVCDEKIASGGVYLNDEKTIVSRTSFPYKLSCLVGESYMVVITDEDKLCLRCVVLINKFDELEAKSLELKRTIVTFVFKKYNLDEDEILEHPINYNKEIIPSVKETSYTKPSFQNNNLVETVETVSLPIEILQSSQEIKINSKNPNQHETTNNSAAQTVKNLDIVIKCEMCSIAKSNNQHHDCCQQSQQIYKTQDTNLNDTKISSVSPIFEVEPNYVNNDITLKEVKKERNDTDENNEPNVDLSSQEAEFIHSEKEVLVEKSQTDQNTLIKSVTQLLENPSSKDLTSNPKKSTKQEKLGATKYFRQSEKKPIYYSKKLRLILPKLKNFNDLAKIIKTETHTVKKANTKKIKKDKPQTIKVSDKVGLDYTELNCTTCKICRIDFETLEQLNLHNKRHTTNDNSLTCSFCGKTFKTFSGVRDHTINCHTKKFAYYCDFCGRGFTTVARLEDHRSSHTQESRYVCDICGKRFIHQSTYWIHNKWHTDPQPYKCDECGQRFKHSSLLAVHRRKHTGERPYKCSHCSLTFSVSNSCKRHMILHTRKYPFHCQVCHVGFTTRFKYTSHMAKSHNKVVTKPAVEKKNLKMAVYEDEKLPLEESPTKPQIIQDDLSSNGSIYKFPCLEDTFLNHSEDLNDDDVVEIVLSPSTTSPLDGLISEVWLE